MTELQKIKHTDFSHPTVQFIRRGKRSKSFTYDPETGYILTDVDRNPLFRLCGGKKVGVLFAGTHPDFPDDVFIGFNLVHRSDKNDYIAGKKEKDFGKNLAAIRSYKWKDKKTPMMGSSQDLTAHFEQGDIIYIPDSIAKDIADFVTRCRRYYKDKLFPVWTAPLQDVK